MQGKGASSLKRQVLMSKWKGVNSPPTSVNVLPDKVINENVSKYVNKCNSVRVEPILDYVVAITDPTVSKCILSYRKTPLTEADIACISESLRTNTNIEEIDLRGNPLSITAATELALGLKANKGITKLNLDENDLKSEGVLRIAAGLRENLSHSAVQVLSLKSNQIGNHGAAGLSELLSTNVKLTELDLQHNAIKDQGAIALAASLKVNTMLRILNLRFNELSNTGAAALGTTLRLNSTLTELDLGGNKIGDLGAEELAGGLSSNSTLLKLNLRSNSIGDSGAVCLAEALKINKTLKELYVGSNLIAATGCTSIADSLKENTSLTKLDLQGIEMGTSGALAIADAIRLNTTLLRLVVDLTQLGREEASAIACSIRANPSLIEINVDIDPEVISSIASTLKLNKYVAGIVDDPNPQKRTGSSLSVRGTSSSPTSAGSPSSMHLNRDHKDNESVNEMLSTMGDKVKNLILREREGKKRSQSNLDYIHTPPSPPPHSDKKSNPTPTQLNPPKPVNISQITIESEDTSPQISPHSHSSLHHSPHLLPDASPPFQSQVSGMSSSKSLTHDSSHRSKVENEGTFMGSSLASPHQTHAEPPRNGSTFISQNKSTRGSSSSQIPIQSSSQHLNLQQPQSQNLPQLQSQSQTLPQPQLQTQLPSLPQQPQPQSQSQSQSQPRSQTPIQPQAQAQAQAQAQSQNQSQSSQSQSQPRSQTPTHNQPQPIQAQTQAQAHPHSQNQPHPHSQPPLHTLPHSHSQNPTHPHSQLQPQPQPQPQPQDNSTHHHPSAYENRPSAYETDSSFETLVTAQKGLEKQLSTQDRLLSSLEEQIKGLRSGLGEKTLELAEKLTTMSKWKDEFKKTIDDQASDLHSVRSALLQLSNQPQTHPQTHPPPMAEVEGMILKVVSRVMSEHTTKVDITTTQIEDNAVNIELLHHKHDSFESDLKRLFHLISKVEIDLANTRLNQTQSPAPAPIVHELVEKTEQTLRADFEKGMAALEEKVQSEEHAKTYLNEVRITTFGERISFVEKELTEKLKLIEKQAGLSNVDRRERDSFSQADERVLGYLEEKINRVEELVRHQQAIVKTIETRTQSDSGRIDRRMGEIFGRMDMLEETLRAEQETSLKALEAILND